MDSAMQMVTQRIINELEAGTIPWIKPWSSEGRAAFNRISGHEYSLLNQMLLSHPGEYATYRQWNNLGGYPLKGTGETVVFWKWPDPEEPDLDESIDIAKPSDNEAREMAAKKRHSPILKRYTVYHVSNVEGIEPLPSHEPMRFETTPIARVQKVFDEYVAREGIRVDYGLTDGAFYSPLSDSIHLPSVEHFEHAEAFAGVSFHEAAHSTGHPKRMNRPGLQNSSFGTAIYSREELVAEICSCAICSKLQISGNSEFRNSVAYIEGWLSVLRTKGNQAVVVHAAAQAEKAMRLILGPTNMDEDRK